MFWLLVVFLYAPIVILIVFSFNDSEIVSFPWLGFTTRWYHEFLANPAILEALKTSLQVATMTAIVATALAIPASIALVRRRFFAKGLMSGLLLAPLVIPLIVLAISLLILFNAIGVPLSPYTAAIGHVVIAMPFAILTMVPRLERIPAALEEASRDLGASSMTTFRLITFPLLLPAHHLGVPDLVHDLVRRARDLVVHRGRAGHVPRVPVLAAAAARAPAAVIAVAVVVLVVSVIVVVASEVGRFFSERRLEAQTGVSRRRVRLSANRERMTHTDE